MKLPKVQLPHIKLKQLTKVLIVAGVAVAIVLLTVAVVHDYRVKQNKKLTEQAQQVAAQEAKTVELQRKLTLTEQAYATERARCEAGKSFYDKASTSVKRSIKVQGPKVCGQAVLQF